MTCLTTIEALCTTAINISHRISTPSTRSTLMKMTRRSDTQNSTMTQAGKTLHSTQPTPMSTNNSRSTANLSKITHTRPSSNNRTKTEAASDSKSSRCLNKHSTSLRSNCRIISSSSTTVSRWLKDRDKTQINITSSNTKSDSSQSSPPRNNSTTNPNNPKNNHSLADTTSSSSSSSPT